MNYTLALPLALLALAAGNPAGDPLDAMEAELHRSAHELRLPNRAPPYYVSYWVVDFDQHDVEATLGAIVASNRDRGRRVRVELRVGDRKFDNSNFMGEGGFFAELFSNAGLTSPRPAPMSDDAALQRVLWLATDAAYKGAVETLEKKVAARQSEVSRDDEVENFSEPVQTKLTIEPTPGLGDEKVHEDLARAVSAVFRQYPDIQTSSVHVVASTERRYFVSTEGSRIAIDTPYAEIEIACRTQAEDGMSLERSAWLGSLSTEVKTTEKAVEEAHRIAKELVALRNAPVLEDYSGPVLFEGRAAAQITNELLAEALSGTPPPKGAETLGSALEHKVGKRILPKGFIVFDDPTLTEHSGQPLLGHYLVDDEGVRPERALLVDRGRLRGFLMSRSPRRDVARSTGHGRSGLAGWARGRPGNLVVSSKDGISARALRQRLVQMLREEGQSHGLLVTELERRGSSSNGQVVPEPQLVYKVTLDGKEQLVRGATLGPLSVRDLKDVVAAGRELSAFHYAAPSPGGFAMPTSVVAPALLFEDVEVKRRPEPSKRPPIVPRP